MFSENGLCPDRIPTDEEITILWQGVHRALVQRDGAAGDSQHYASLCNNSNNGDLQHARSNVSHITIDGGHLMSNMKSGVRVNPILSSQPSAHFAFARRKQINENNENKRKALLEQRRQMPASSARKPTGAGQNISQAPIQVHSQCMFEPVRVTGGINHSDEDGTTQFLIPENLVNLSAAEGEILAGLDTPQPYRQIAVRNRPPRQGMSSLSFEEHKVLQSLDRINHRLQSHISLIYGYNASQAKRYSPPSAEVKLAVYSTAFSSFSSVSLLKGGKRNLCPRDACSGGAPKYLAPRKTGSHGNRWRV
ncbi:putative centrosomal protein [Crotalus adamanteus]|uniref:Centrosomal protein n=1 Tax=Crotalus adamanteus TaxID=8729 RepID=A0AAW1BJV4_CROAD